MLWISGHKLSQLLAAKKKNAAWLTRRFEGHRDTIYNILKKQPEASRCQEHVAKRIADALKVDLSEIEADETEIARATARAKQTRAGRRTSESTSVEAQQLLSFSAPQQARKADTSRKQRTVLQEMELPSRRPEQIMQPFLQDPITYNSSLAALDEMVSACPVADELIYLGFSGRWFYEDLRRLSNTWRIDRIRILLCDLVNLTPEGLTPIPVDPQWLEEKRSQQEMVLSELRAALRSCLAHRSWPVRFFMSVPVVRFILIRRKDSKRMGFMSFYAERSDIKGAFWAREQPILRLSEDSEWGKLTIAGLWAWLDLVWEHTRAPMSDIERGLGGRGRKYSRRCPGKTLR